MRLGLFNWTSDLSDEPEYPPFFDNLRMSEDYNVWKQFDEMGAEKIKNAKGNCIVRIDGGGGFDSTDIGGVEYLHSPLMSIIRLKKKSSKLIFSSNPDSLRIDAGRYLVLNQFFMKSWMSAYIDENYWKGYKPHVKEKFEQDPDAWCLATTGFTSEQIRDNFVFWLEAEGYVCLNPDWNAKAVEILTAQSPSLMRKFNNCIQLAFYPTGL